MNLLEKLMLIINKQKQAILFSQKDKEIIREISQCNNSYYKTKVLDVLQCELSDWCCTMKEPSLWTLFSDTGDPLAYLLYRAGSAGR